MTDKKETDQIGAAENESEDEEIIELGNAVTESPAAVEPVPDPMEDGEISLLGDDDVIEDFDDDLEDDMGIPVDDDDDFVESMGMEVGVDDGEEDTEPDFQGDTPEAVLDAGSVPLTPEQIEAAAERVVKEMFSEKIESILIDVVKKAITKEIERLKNTLLEDLKGDE